MKQTEFKQKLVEWLNENHLNYEESTNLDNGGMELILEDLKQVIRFGLTTNIDAVQEWWKKDYKCFTVFPWFDFNKVIGYLEYSLKLKKPRVFYARKLDIQWKPVDPEIRQFIGEYHILGKVAHKNPIEAACFYNDGELIGVGTFIAHKMGAELKRMVFKTDVSIVGGASKIIKDFCRRHPTIKTLVTYSDNDISNGNVYTLAGMTHKDNKIVAQHVFYNEHLNKKFSLASLWMIGADRLFDGAKDPITGEQIYWHAGIDPSIPVGNIELVTKPCYDICQCGFKDAKYCFTRYEDAGNIFHTMQNPFYEEVATC